MRSLFPLIAFLLAACNADKAEDAAIADQTSEVAAKANADVDAAVAAAR